MPGRGLIRRIWAKRPWILYGFLFFVMLCLIASLVMEPRVRRYEADTPRDAMTGIMEGAAPRILGPPDAGKAILFIHGFIGTPNNFNDLPDVTAAAGWYSEAMLLPGHGTTPHEFERTPPEEIIGGVFEKARDLRKTHKTLVILGHSMGGALATLAAKEVQPDGLILVAPYYGLSKYPPLDTSLEVLARVIAPILRWIPARPGGAPVALAENRAKVLDYGWVPTRGMQAAMAIRRRAVAPGVLEAIDCPVLLVQSHNDSVTNWHASDAQSRRFPNASVETRWLEESDHVVFWDYDAETVKKQVLAFLARYQELPPPNTP